jgi:hypothetical protein
MADSFNLYIASGSTDTFSIPFGYLDPSHITVSLDGVSTPFTFPSASQAQVTSGNPTASTVVEVRRTTPRTSREIVWQNASNLTATDLNTSDLQFLYITQEAFDTSENAILLASDDKYEANSKIIKNVAAPVEDTDAVNKAYADIASSSTTQDVIDAEAAKVAAESAKTDAEIAESNAQAILTNVQLVYDDFDDRYLGVKTSDPVVDNDGETLQDGALYYNTTSNNIRFYDLGSTTWLIIDTVIGDGTLPLTKLVDQGERTLVGRAKNSGTGAPVVITTSQIRDIIGSATTSARGIVESATTPEMDAGTPLKFPDCAEVKSFVDTTITGVASSAPVAKVWCFVSLSGGIPTLEDSHNVSSITDQGVGRFRINFTTPFSSENYPSFVAGHNGMAESGSFDDSQVHTKTASYAEVSINLGVTATVDQDFSFMAFGSQ